MPLRENSSNLIKSYREGRGIPKEVISFFSSTDIKRVIDYVNYFDFSYVKGKSADPLFLF